MTEMPKYQSDSNFAVFEDPLLPKSHGQLNIRSSFVRANAQKLLRCFLPRQVNISTSLNKKLLCSTLSADLATLLRGWQPRKQAAAVYRVCRICSETSPQHVHTQLLLIFFFDIMKETEKKKNQQKKKKPEQLEHKQWSPPSSEDFLRLVSHRRKLRNFQNFSGKTGSNFQTGAFWAQTTVK